MTVTALAVYLALFMAIASLLELISGEAPEVITLGVVGALAATTFHPLQVRLREVMDELLFGQRPNQLDAATRVVGQLGDDPGLALRAIRGALLLPYAALELPGRPRVASGAEVPHTTSLPLPLGDGESGELVVGLRPGDLRLPAADAHVLGLVARCLRRPCGPARWRPT